jgi:hypothetical protein
MEAKKGDPLVRKEEYDYGQYDYRVLNGTGERNIRRINFDDSANEPNEVVLCPVYVGHDDYSSTHYLSLAENHPLQPTPFLVWDVGTVLPTAR